MQHTKSVEEFANCNDTELRRLVSSICVRQRVSSSYVDDVVQEVYIRMMRSSILQRFDPNFGGFSTKISTYLYRVASNLVIGMKKRGQYKIESGKYRATKRYIEDTGETDDVEIALRCCNTTPEFQSILEHNSETEGLSADLEEFEKRWLGNTYRNRKFTLSRRKNKDAGKDGCTLLDVYRLINQGLNNRQIGEIYGVSGAFISSLKRIIGRSLKAYGINRPRDFKPDNWFESEEENNPEIQVVTPDVVKAELRANVKSVGKNGHKHEKTRDMTGEEKELFRNWWISRSGVITEDSLCEFKKKYQLENVAIMQFVGVSSILHRSLAKGTVQIADREGYNANRISRGQSTIPLNPVAAVKISNPDYTCQMTPFEQTCVREWWVNHGKAVTPDSIRFFCLKKLPKSVTPSQVEQFIGTLS